MLVSCLIILKFACLSLKQNVEQTDSMLPSSLCGLHAKSLVLAKSLNTECRNLLKLFIRFTCTMMEVPLLIIMSGA